MMFDLCRDIDNVNSQKGKSYYRLYGNLTGDDKFYSFFDK